MQKQQCGKWIWISCLEEDSYAEFLMPIFGEKRKKITNSRKQSKNNLRRKFSYYF